MKAIRSRFLVATIVAADVTIILGGLPLLRYTWLALEQHAQDMPLLTQLLLANLMMLLLVLAAMVASGMLSVRVVRAAAKYSSKAFARPMPIARTRSLR